MNNAKRSFNWNRMPEANRPSICERPDPMPIAKTAFRLIPARTIDAALIAPRVYCASTGRFIGYATDCERS